MGRKPCAECGAQTVWLDTYNGARKQFDAVQVDNPDAPDTVRWYVFKRRGAVPATVVARPKDTPFLMLHHCRATRVGVGGPHLEAHTIANTTGPRVRDVQLDDRFAFSYRWVANWAHIVTRHVALCSARVLELTSDAERARLAQMPVCPTCLARYPGRLARLG